MLSELKTEEAFLQSITEPESALARFNHRPAERHLVTVLSWVLKLEGPVAERKTFTEQDMKKIAEQGFPKLAAEIAHWCQAEHIASENPGAAL